METILPCEEEREREEEKVQRLEENTFSLRYKHPVTFAYLLLTHKDIQLELRVGLTPNGHTQWVG